MAPEKPNNTTESKKASPRLCVVPPPEVGLPREVTALSAATTKEPELQIPGIDSTKVETAKTHLRKAMEIIKQRYQPQLKKAGIVVDFEDIPMYLALMIKESKLNNAAVSVSGAKGYFQMKDIAKETVKGVIKEEPRGTDEVVNCVYGIIFLSICIKQANNGMYKDMSANDKKDIALMIYNKGGGNMKTLFEVTGAKSLKDLNVKLENAVGQLFGVKTGGKEVTDKNYGVRYHQPNIITRYLELLGKDPSGILKKDFIYNGRNTGLRVEQICEVLRYYRVIVAIDRKLKLPSRKDLADEVAESPRKPPHFWKVEIMKPDRLLWSVCHEMAGGIFDGYETSSPEDKEDARSALIQIIMQYNMKYNPKFKDFDKAEAESDNPSIPTGITLFIPTKSYIEDEYSKLQKEEEKKTIPKVSLDKMPKGIPVYANDPEGILEKEGNKILQNKYKYNGDRDAKKRQGGLITPKFGPRKSSRSIKRTETKYIVLHSLNSDDASGPIENGAAHYVVDRNGVINYVVNRRFVHNHCGARYQKKTKAMWNGDDAIVMKSIGIEVAGVPGNGWTDKQYEAVKKLIHWLGAEYKIKAKNVLTHRQVAYSQYRTRGRKGDPYGLNWAKLGLPDNSRLVDMDVATGRLESNLGSIEMEMKKEVYDPKEKDKTRVGAWYGNKETDLAGLKYAIALRDRLKTSKTTTNNYIVKKGDTLSAIARKNNLTVEDLKKLNDLKTDAMSIGQKLKIPKN